MIKIVEGNILNATEDIIGHQVNCQGVMGAGLAKQIRNKYPEVFKEYTRLVGWTKEEYKKGYIETDLILLGVCQLINTHDNKVISNLFAQYEYGRSKRHTDYDALRKSLLQLEFEVAYNEYGSVYGKSVALPYGIGCGLAGGDWNIVYKIIDDVFSDYEVALYKLK